MTGWKLENGRLTFVTSDGDWMEVTLVEPGSILITPVTSASDEMVRDKKIEELNAKIDELIATVRVVEILMGEQMRKDNDRD